MRFIDAIKSRAGKPIEFEKIEGQIKGIVRDFGIILFYIYGSYAFGTGSKLSDLDIAFLGRKRISFDKQLKLIERLQDVFEEEAVDLVDLSRVPLSLIHRILRDGRCLYAKSLSERIEFETRCENLYLDAEPLRREYEQALIRRIEDGSYGH
jgi:predicted nucleotidyltransferase